MVKKYENYLDQAIQESIDKFGSMSSEFHKSNKELIAQSLLTSDVHEESMKKQDEIIETLKDISKNQLEYMEKVLEALNNLQMEKVEVKKTPKTVKK